MVQQSVYSQFVPQLSEEEAKVRAELFKALGNQARWLILSLLLDHGGEICVEEIARSLPRWEQPTVSHHLSVLTRVGLLDNRNDGTFKYYFVKSEAYQRLADSIICFK